MIRSASGWNRLIRGALSALAFLPLLLAGCARNDAQYAFAPNPDAAANGFAPGLYTELDDALAKAVWEGVVPGASLTVRRDGQLIYERAAGVEVPGTRQPVKRSTYFDVASLTKPVAGVPAALLLARNWPELRDGSPSVEQILTHRAGYAANVDINQIRGEGLAGFLDRQRPVAMPGGFDLYSNTGYMVLSWQVAKLLGNETGIENEIRRYYWDPVGETAFTWKPNGLRVAASGRDADGKWVRGTPYDPVAALWIIRPQIPSFPPLHSGLFATSGDVALFVDGLMKPGVQDSGNLAFLRDVLLGAPSPKAAIDEAGRTIYRTPGGLESAMSPPWGDGVSPPGRFLFQTGYTGCLLWVDKGTRTTVVLLTNASAVEETRERWTELADRVVRAVMVNTAEGWSPRN
ncbi:MAG: serine hydrolase domain-containing protein [Candidatus Sumerlaeia bacterium]|nr:serine hydrolase domain-containing protein [Candidatus Sumerlaeia bacterium]